MSLNTSSPSSSSQAADPASVVVPHGPRKDLLVLIAIFPSIAAILTAVSGVIAGISSGDGSSSGLRFAVLNAIVLYGLAIFATVPIYVMFFSHRVVLSPGGVRILRGFGPLRVNWGSIDPTPKGPISLGIVVFRWSPDGSTPFVYLFLASPTQARALLTYPSCPKRPLPPKTIRLLGLPSGWPVSGGSM